MNLLVKDVPESVHSDFRVFCAMNDKTVKDCVIDLLEKCAETVKPLRAKKGER